MRLPEGLHEDFDTKERFMDIAAAGVLAVRAGITPKNICNPYELDEVDGPVNTVAGLAIRLFSSPRLLQRFIGVASYEIGGVTDVIGLGVQGCLSEVRAFLEATDLSSIKYFMGQSVYDELTDTQRSTLEELMADIIAVRAIPNLELPGEILF
jgi:hypothetical protein